MRNIVRLAAGSNFQLATAIGAPIVPWALSTLNEAINNADIVPFQPTVPTAGMQFADDYNYQVDGRNVKLQYIAIGCGGHASVTGATHGIPTTQNIPHRGRDTGLYHMIPFVIKPLSEDLTNEQRANYRLRKVISIDGVMYAAYYLRFHDLSTLPIVSRIVTVVNGVKQSTPYIPTAKDQHPSQPAISGANDGSYIHTYISTEVAFSSEEARWLREVAALLFGDENAAIVSEIAFCSGVDKQITKRYPVSGDQSPIQMNTSLREAMAVQINVVESTHMAMTFMNGYVSEKINIGTEDPLYGQSSSNG